MLLLVLLNVSIYIMKDIKGVKQMPSPFPGMDPYLEDSIIWRGVHHELISLIAETLNTLLPPESE